jgi:hypothetical protein
LVLFDIAALPACFVIGMVRKTDRLLLAEGQIFRRLLERRLADEGCEQRKAALAVGNAKIPTPAPGPAFLPLELLEDGFDRRSRLRISGNRNRRQSSLS